MARSIAASVGRSKFPAAVASPAPSAARIRLIIVRTRVRLARLTAARCTVCLARFSTDFFRFLTFVGVPAGIQGSSLDDNKSTTVADEPSLCQTGDLVRVRDINVSLSRFSFLALYPCVYDTLGQEADYMRETLQSLESHRAELVQQIAQLRD